MGPVAGNRVRRAEQTYRPPAEVGAADVALKTMPVPDLSQMGYEAEIRPELDHHVAWVELDERGEVQREFAWHELGYLVRNPCSDTWTVGYGRSELEYLIAIVTGLVTGVQFNVDYFTDNYIPTGILILAGEWQEEKIEQFHADLIAKAAGPGNYHRLPLLFSSDPQAVAQFLNLRMNTQIDMYWERWLSWITTVICALYGMAPEEIYFQSFRGVTQALQEADPATRIQQGHDTGFVPLMTHIATFINENVIWRIDEDFEFQWQNLDPHDEQRELNLIQMRLNAGMLSINEARAERDEPEIKDPLDPELYRRIEQRVQRKWPDLRGDAVECQRVTRQIYESLGGRYARWPDAPGMPSIIMQLYMQEAMSAGSEGEGAGGSGGDLMSVLAGLGSSGAAGASPESGSPSAEAESGMGADDPAAPFGPSSEGEGKDAEDAQDLLRLFMPPDMTKSLPAQLEPAALAHVSNRLDQWRRAVHGSLDELIDRELANIRGES